MLRKLDILVASSLHCIDMHSSDLGKIYPFHLKNIFPIHNLTANYKKH